MSLFNIDKTDMGYWHFHLVNNIRYLLITIQIFHCARRFLTYYCVICFGAITSTWPFHLFHHLLFLLEPVQQVPSAHETSRENSKQFGSFKGAGERRQAYPRINHAVFTVMTMTCKLMAFNRTNIAYDSCKSLYFHWLVCTFSVVICQIIPRQRISIYW